MANITIVHTETIDETKPAGTRARSLGDDDIREFKRSIRERLAIDHRFLADETGVTSIGTHKKITFSETQALDPTAYDDCGYLYMKTVSGVKELFWMDEDGNVTQLTSSGKLLGESVRASNNQYITAKNAAGTGTVNLIKANALDIPVVPDGIQTATSAAPLVDAGIANKLYVDGKFNATTGHDHDGTDSKLLTGLGAWVDKSASYGAQQATTDGFVLVNFDGVGADGNVQGYSDANANPTTLRARGTETHQYPGSFMFPVIKTHYWKVILTTGNINSVYWIPLGV